MIIEKHTIAFNDGERAIHYRKAGSLSYVVAIRQQRGQSGWNDPAIDVQYMSDLGIYDIEDLCAVLADAASVAERWAKSKKAAESEGAGNEDYLNQ